MIYPRGLAKTKQQEFSLFRLFFSAWLILLLWSYVYDYDELYVAGLTSFLCYTFCFIQGRVFWGVRTLPKFSSTPSEKFENGVHTVGYYFYYRFYLKKLIHLAVRVWAYGDMPKKNTTARSAPLVARQCTPPREICTLLSDKHWFAPGFILMLMLILTCEPGLKDHQCMWPPWRHTSPSCTCRLLYACLIGPLLCYFPLCDSNA